jgi:cytochrome P450
LENIEVQSGFMTCPAADGDVPEYPTPRTNPFQLPAELSSVGSPVTQVRLWNGSVVWLVTGHAEARAVLTDRRFSSDPRQNGFPMVARSYGAFRMDGELGFSQMDDPEHARQRRMLAREFAVSKVEAHRAMVREVAEGLVTSLMSTAQPADFVPAFSAAMPVMVLARLLGVPYEDQAFFHSRTTVRFSRNSTAADLAQANVDMNDYLDHLVDLRMREPGDDLFSKLVTEQVAPGELTRAQAAAMGTLLLLTGHRSTTNIITLSVLTLLTHPSLRASLLAGDVTVDRVAEELLRFHTIGDAGLPRLATAPVEIGGVTIGAGDGVVVSIVAANRDPRRFSDPNTVDPARDATRHLNFGAGGHHCLGQGLARLELHTAIDVVIRRLPTLELAVDVEELSAQGDMSLHGLLSMPVRW